MKMNQIVQFYRKKAKMSQKELAEKLFVSEKTISSYETGTRGISTDVLERMAKIFNMDVQDFFDKKKVEEDIRKSKIKQVAATITKEFDKELKIGYWVEIDVPETGELLEEWTSDFFYTFEEAEQYIEREIETRYELLNYHEKDLTDIIEVTFVSCWDGGYAEFKSKAKYDQTENVVFDIEGVDTSGIDIEILDRQYIIFPDGTEKEVVDEDDAEEYGEEIESGKMVLLKW